MIKEKEFISVNKWGSWHNLCYNLAHSLSDTINMGWVYPETTYNQYVSCIKFCISFIDDELIDKELPCVSPYRTDDLIELSSVPKNEISCLEQDIFTALFAIKEMMAAYKLEEGDFGKLEPVEKHLHSLIPWIKWED